MGRSPAPPTYLDVELDLGRYELRVNGRRAHLERLPMELLILLHERQPQLVTRDEIVARLWGEKVFLDAKQGINSAIGKIRRALNDDPERPRHIETVVGRGYRLISPIRVIPKPVGPEIRSGENDARKEAESVASSPWKRRLLWAGVAAAVVIGMTGAGFDAWKARRPAAATTSIRSLAVLPLQDLSDGPVREIFADGMTDVLITDLAQINSLRVISRTSVMPYKHRFPPARQIGRELNVDALVEGTVVRFGDRVRITTQLIDARTDRNLWARTYEGDATDILAVEDNVAEAIATEIGARFSTKKAALLAASHKVKPQAYQAYLYARFLNQNDRNAQGARQSLRYALQAVSLDPHFALGYVGVARSYVSLSNLGGDTAEMIPKARTAAERAVQLDPSLGAAHTALGMISLIYDHDWAGARAELQMGVDLGPNDSSARRGYGQYLMASGRFDEAIEQMRKAQKLDPLTMMSSRELGRAYYYARRYREAIVQFRKARKLATQNTNVDNWLGWAYEKKGMEQAAVESLISSASEDGMPPRKVAALQKAAAGRGLRGFARDVLKLLGPRASAAGGYEMAILYVESGDRTRAFDCLERAYRKRSVWVTWIAVDPEMDPLRGDPRFQSLLKRMRLSP